jgi:cytochrome c-type biogenesis protein CcmH/NrfG
MGRESHDRAQKVLTSAARRFPGSEPVQWALGEFSMNRKDYVTAHDHFRRAVRADAKAVRSWIGLGSAAFRLQKNQESLDAFVKACKLNNRDLKSFRTALGELRGRKDTQWQGKFENGINECL